MFPVNNCSPIPALMAMYENYGTIVDRDYVVTVSGKQMNKTYSVVPMDKNKFRNEKAKPYSKKSILKMLDKAWPCEDSSEDDEEEEEEVEGNIEDYMEQDAKELYKECKKRGLEVKPKRPKKYYANQLVADDKAKDDWDDDEDVWVS